MGKSSCGLGWVVAFIMAGAGCAGPKVAPTGDPKLSFPGEKRLQNIRQLTAGGTNAEAYWSFDGTWLSFQHKGPGLPAATGPEAPCDQIYAIKADGTEIRRISNGKGRTTCSFYYPDASRILYSSTYSADEACPVNPDMSRGYVWPIYPTYQLYASKADGSDPIPIEPGAPRAYNAEATVCKDGSVVFTSDRDGDLELYRARLNSNGTLADLKRLTHTPGYDGGAFFSPDCSKIVWRTSRPAPGKELEDFRALLKQHLVRPGRLEIWMANADGTDARQITRVGAASFAPFFTPDGERVIFASNPRDPKGRKFDLYLVRTNGTGLEQVTNSDTFDSFPMFSPDGKYLAFSSNRNGKAPRETNLFIADWVETPMAPVSLDDTRPADRYLALVERLSAPEMEGRGIGTPGLAHAEDLVEKQFERAGLQPFFGSYRQSVEMQTGVEVVSGGTHFTPLDKHQRGVARKEGEEFTPAAFSSNGTFEGSVVDAGYGIVAPELGINDFQKLDVRNKAALIRRHVPKELKLTPGQERAYSDLRYKAFLAREKGAKAIIFWDETDALNSPKNGTSAAVGIPVIFVRGKLGPELGGTLVSLGVELKRATVTTHNIVGTLGGACGRVEPVVIGAHLDHLGLGGRSSLDAQPGAIHFGADDNASGVAAIVEAARFLSAQKTDAACYVFAAFTGEETGVVGSAKLAELLNAKRGWRPRAMLNLDMVGRLRENQLLVFGTESAKEWAKVVEDECGTRMLTCKGGGDGYGPSDHMPFYIAGVPVLHFFTGAHADYHRSTDTAEKINATGGVQVAEVVSAVALRAASGKLHYQRAKEAPSMGALARMGDRRSSGAYLGTIPDYATMASPSGPGGDTSASGVKLAGVRPGSPAEKAGVRAGDILEALTTFEGEAKTDHSLKSLEDFMYVLTGLKPGDRIRLVVRRDAGRVELPAVVGKRD